MMARSPSCSGVMYQPEDVARPTMGVRLVREVGCVFVARYLTPPHLPPNTHSNEMVGALPPRESWSMTLLPSMLAIYCLMCV